jgi:hypothetical protein
LGESPDWTFYFLPSSHFWDTRGSRFPCPRKLVSGISMIMTMLSMHQYLLRFYVCINRNFFFFSVLGLELRALWLLDALPFEPLCLSPICVNLN